MKPTSATPGSVRPRRRALCLAVGLMLAAASVGAAAQGTAAPSTDATVNLIRLLVKKGLLTQTEASGLLDEANAEARQARQAEQDAGKMVAVTAGDGAKPGDVRVTYVPQSVRNQITAQVKQQVVAQAVHEHWAQPNALPDWLSRISWYGDIQVRDESWLLSRSNDPYLIDYAALNRTGPYDVNLGGTNRTNPPLLNTQQDRTNMLRLQAHIGMAVKLGDTVTAGIRIGSGGDNNPVSTTQTLGGGLTKKNLWLDRAWVRWKPSDWVSVTAGRMPDPFFVSDLLFSPELNFDGVAGQFQLPFGDDSGAFATVGMFPIDITSNDAPADATGDQKYHSNDKWLSAAQLGARFRFGDDTRYRVALAYYYFDRMRGELSQPCALYTGINYCSTDDTVPDFMQWGNTLFLIRDILPDTSSPDNYAQPQFVGLAYNYRVAALTQQLDFKIGDVPVRVQADYSRNMAYHARNAFDRYPYGLGQPINNYQAGPVENGVTTNGPYQSGPVGWLVRGIVGTPDPKQAHDWNISLGYKYLQPDATLDGLTDANFHLGGTNAKGYILAADYGIAPSTYLSLRYYDAKAVYGPPYATDVLRLEVNAKF